MSGLTTLALELLAVLLVVAALGFAIGRMSVRTVAPTAAAADREAPVAGAGPPTPGQLYAERLLQQAMARTPAAQPEPGASQGGGDHGDPSQDADDQDLADEDVADHGGTAPDREIEPLADPEGVEAEPAGTDPEPDAEAVPTPVFDDVLAMHESHEASAEPATGDSMPSPASEPAVSAQQLADLLRAKDEEMGRLETGALTALERTITRFQGQVDGLEQELRDVRSHHRDLDIRVAEESKRAQRLQDALAERDAHLATLRRELEARA